MSKAILGTMRLPFLTLVPPCVLLGVSTAYLEKGGFDWLYLLLAFLGALAAHIGVNALNEYSDFRSGLDLKTERTPFSGGSGTLAAEPDKARYALLVGSLSLMLVGLIGLYFVFTYGWKIAPLGLLGIFVIVAYTPLMTRSSLLCLISPGLGFGILMVNGTHFVLTGSYHMSALVASLLPFFLVSNLLLMNQFPDLEADREVGRRHLIIAHGRQAGVRVFALFLIGGYLTLLLATLRGLLPLWGLLGLLTLPLAVNVALGLARENENIPALIPFMGKNVMLTHLLPLLVAVGVFIGA